MVSDTHGNFLWMTNGCLNEYKPEETAILILGDCGLDFYLNKTDLKKKKDVEAKGYYIYWLRGNHEARPEDIEGYELIYDEEVKGEVYCDPRFPHLRAFKNYGFYKIKDYMCLIIGGAYSIDKYWRLMRVGLTEETNIPKKSGWFANEQLTKGEMADCLDEIRFWAIRGEKVNFIMTHTCPLKFQPTDLFLGGVDQSSVDDSMERWLDEVEGAISYDAWLFGHYHADRLERPKVEQYYNDIEEIDEIAKRWKEYAETGELPWYLIKSSRFGTI